MRCARAHLLHKADAAAQDDRHAAAHRLRVVERAVREQRHRGDGGAAHGGGARAPEAGLHEWQREARLRGAAAEPQHAVDAVPVLVLVPILIPVLVPILILVVDAAPVLGLP